MFMLRKVSEIGGGGRIPRRRITVLRADARTRAIVDGKRMSDVVVEPAPDGLGLVHEQGRSLRVTWRGADLFRYVYQPWDPQVEAPRPYLHPVYTLGGREVSLYRPHDHLWHKGIAWSLSNVEVVGSGTENFWGGRTYLREH